MLAGKDRAEAFVWPRALDRRLSALRDSGRTSDPATLAMFTALRELEGRFSDPTAADKRRALERRTSSAQVLRGRVHLTRLRLDGTMERAHRDAVARHRL